MFWLKNQLYPDLSHRAPVSGRVDVCVDIHILSSFDAFEVVSDLTKVVEIP